jgi:hypothetical protein
MVLFFVIFAVKTYDKENGREIEGSEKRDRRLSNLR